MSVNESSLSATHLKDDHLDSVRLTNGTRDSEMIYRWTAQCISPPHATYGDWRSWSPDLSGPNKSVGEVGIWISYLI